MGLQQSTTSPCIFIGNLIEGGPPIYIGIYIDDIIYFSNSDDIEKRFESFLSGIGSRDFMGQVPHFLGIGNSFLMVNLQLVLLSSLL